MGGRFQVMRSIIECRLLYCLSKNVKDHHVQQIEFSISYGFGV